jgi:hypothetical protein
VSACVSAEFGYFVHLGLGFSGTQKEQKAINA